MRYIKRFNESVQSDKARNLDFDYIEACFINLLEDCNGVVKYPKDSTHEDWYIKYNLEFPIEFSYTEIGRYPIELIIQNSEEVSELLKEINSCIKKVNIEYPELLPRINFEYVAHEGKIQYRLVYKIIVSYENI